MSTEENIPDTLRTLSGFTWRLLVMVAGFAFILFILNGIFPVVFALFFALLVTAWTSPVMNLYNKLLPKIVSMILALITILVAVVVILGTVVKSSIEEGPKLAASISSGFSDIETWLKTGPLELSNTQFTSLITQLQNWGTSIAKGIAGDALGAVGSIGTLIIAGSVFIFGVIFFLMAPATIWGWILTWIPKNLREHVDVSGRIAWGSIAGYTRGIVVIAFLDATLVFIGLLVLRVPLAPALAAVVFLGAFIPVIGAPIATFFAAVVALAENGPVTALLVILLTIIVGSFDGDVMQPLVMGKAVNLHPLAIVIVIAAGSIALGIVGALIAVPIAGAVYGVSKYLTGRDPEHPYAPTEPFEHAA
ncbi:MAG: AI-2E family transporter [Actinobacteria bacterium]|nr:AI-2E family transporter [Actinomycetota bacterium]MTB27159.1 AI-2E family transporter [Actinomycetota bacterium]